MRQMDRKEEGRAAAQAAIANLDMEGAVIEEGALPIGEIKPWLDGVIDTFGTANVQIAGINASNAVAGFIEAIEHNPDRTYRGHRISPEPAWYPDDKVVVKIVR